MTAIHRYLFLAMALVPWSAALGHPDDDPQSPQFAKVLNDPAHRNLTDPGVKRDAPGILLIPLIKPPLSSPDQLPPPRLARPVGETTPPSPGGNTGTLTPFPRTPAELIQANKPVRTKEDLEVVRLGTLSAVRQLTNGRATVQAIQSGPASAGGQGLVGSAGRNISVSLDELQALERIMKASQRSANDIDRRDVRDPSLSTKIEETGNLLQRVNGGRPR